MKRISPEEAAAKMEEGYVYLDVRSVPEFEEGHPKGAYNIPLMHAGSSGMSPNSRFMEEVAKAFPQDSKIIVGCKSGGRSVSAAALMEMARLKVGDEVSITVHEGGAIVLTPLRPVISPAKAAATAKRLIRKNAELFRRLA